MRGTDPIGRTQLSARNAGPTFMSHTHELLRVPRGRLRDPCPHRRGRIGEVYKARDPRLNREVAIKVLLAAVVGKDPDWSRLPAQMPPSTHRLLRPGSRETKRTPVA